MHDERWFGEKSIELLLGRQATRVDGAAHEIELDGRERIGYDEVAAGNRFVAAPTPVPGSDLDGVLYLRRVEDSDGSTGHDP